MVIYLKLPAMLLSFPLLDKMQKKTAQKLATQFASLETT